MGHILTYVILTKTLKLNAILVLILQTRKLSPGILTRLVNVGCDQPQTGYGPLTTTANHHVEPHTWERWRHGVHPFPVSTAGEDQGVDTDPVFQPCTWFLSNARP